MNPVIATWFHADDRTTASRFSQVGGDSTTTPFQRVYWRCVLTFFGTSVRWNTGCRHVFVTNLSALPRVEGVWVEEWMNEHHIDVIRNVKLSRVPPEDFWGSWRNQFYVFDALRAAGERAGQWDGLYLFDSDCLWLAPHDRLSSVVMQEGAALYTLPFGPEHVENGVRIGDLSLISKLLLQQPLRTIPTYNGGEIIALNPQAYAFIMDHVDRLFEANLDAFRGGRPYLKEEAHFLSALYAVMGMAAGTANTVIRRIWTGRNYNDQAPGDFALDIWHLPDEKRLGLARLFRTMMREHSWFWSAGPEEFRKRAGWLVGIPKRSEVRFHWARIVNKVTLMMTPQ
jgi:hypothetical protein